MFMEPEISYLMLRERNLISTATF